MWIFCVLCACGERFSRSLRGFRVVLPHQSPVEIIAVSSKHLCRLSDFSYQYQVIYGLPIPLHLSNRLILFVHPYFATIMASTGDVLQTRSSRQVHTNSTSPTALSNRAHSPSSSITTILVHNVHCASCVSHIRSILSDLDKEIHEVNVSIVSHEVQVFHGASTSAQQLCQTLVDAAFEVDSARTADPSGVVVSQIEYPKQPDGWLEATTKAWTHAQKRDEGSGLQECLPLPVRSKRKRHIENCAACQKDQIRSPTRPFEAPTTFPLEKADARPLYRDNLTKSKVEVEQAKSLSRQATDKAPSVNVSTKPNSTTTPEDGFSTAPDPTKTQSPRYNLTLSIGGMTCASCTHAVDEALQRLDYVITEKVDLMTNSATIEFSGPESFSKQIIETIEDIGYEADLVSCALVGPKPTANTKGDRNAKAITYSATLSISGMTCASCTNAVTDALKDLDFVKSCNVTLMTNSAAVEFEGFEHLSHLVEAVDDLGYGCTVDKYEKLGSAVEDEADASDHKVPRSIQLAIDGLFCEHCPPRVIERLSQLPVEVTIDSVPTLQNPIVSITYVPNPPKSTIRDIVAAIDSVDENFSTKISHPPSLEDRSKAMHILERKRILRRLLLSFICAVPTLLIGIVWMSLVPSSNSIRIFYEKPVWAGDVSRAQWALFILATPVFFLAADIFHVRAIKEIRALWRKGSKVPMLRRFYRFGSMNLLISAGTSVAYISSLALLIIDATASPGGGDNTTYFDSVVFLTFFILIGRYLEAYSKSKTGDAVGMLGKLRPHEAILLLASPEPASNESDTRVEKTLFGRTTETIPADLLEVGDLVIVPHGSSPPGDGIIVIGSTRMDESSMTGESRAVTKGPGDKVLVGTINAGDPITVEISGIGGSSMLDQIVAVVREGQTKRAPVERVADILTGYFVPVITALAIITFLAWFALGQSGALPSRYLDDQAGGWAFWSLEFAIAVFVVACPCGIGLAAPTALFVGGGLAAKHGILVRGGGEAFQEAADLDTVVFDKTGTLTEGGTLKVTSHVIVPDDPKNVAMTWAMTRALEEQSSHPIAKAIVEIAKAKSLTAVTMESVSEVPGKGIRGSFRIPSSTEGKGEKDMLYEAALGSEALMASLGDSGANMSGISETLREWKDQAQSIAVLATRSLDPAGPDASSSTDAISGSPEWRIAALFGTSDPIRADAAPTIAKLHRRGIAVYMLTGDNPSTAQAVASNLGIPPSNVFAGVLPTEKADKIRWLQDYGPKRYATRSKPTWMDRLAKVFGKSSARKGSLPDGGSSDVEAGPQTKPHAPNAKAKVAFVGDGTNDSPALTTATISISPSTGSPIALSSSSFILLSESNTLSSIPVLLDLSARVFRRIKFNFLWALLYNVLLVPIAAGVLFEVRSGGGWRLGPVWASAAMAGSSVSVVLGSLGLRWEGGWMPMGRKG